MATVSGSSVASPAVALAADGVVEAAIEAGRSAGRNRSAATAAIVAVMPTTMNGVRRSWSARTAPSSGPRTAPDDPAADTTPFTNASRSWAVTRAMYRRSEISVRPPPSPDIARNAMSGIAAVVVAIRKLPAA